MKNSKMKKSLSLILSLIMIMSTLSMLTVTSFAETSGDWEYTVSDNEATITKYNGSAANVTIPSKLGGYSVTSLGIMAFRNNTSLVSVIIPDSVTSLGIMTFMGCTSLKNVVIGNGVTSLGPYTFNGCTSLTSVTIGKSVTSIDNTFAFRTSLTSINVDINNPSYCSVNGVLFNKDKSELIQYPAGKTDKQYSVPNSVTSIGYSAFDGCASLTSITIPDSVTSIGNQAFSGCTSLTSVTIPNSVTNIGDNAFYGCNLLASITIGNSVTSIGDWAFYGCTSLASITIPKSVTNIGDSAFFGCTSLKSINVDSNNPSYCSVNGVLFNKDKSELVQYPAGKADKEYTIPDSVTSIGRSAFSGCTSLTSITIPNSVTSIGAGAFMGCTSLTSVTIPDSVASIGDFAFADCTSLKSINVDSNNPSYCSVNGVLFNKDKSELIQYPAVKADKEYTIPDSVTSIGVYAFINCTSLTSVTIPDSVTSIGDYAFINCTSLTNINVDSNNPSYCSVNGVLFNKDKSELIQYPAGKTDKEYTIPDSVTSIGVEAFMGCTSLTNINVDSNNPSYCSVNGVLFNKDKSELIQYPAGKTDKEYTIPDSVTSIGMYAFINCTSLTSITIPDSVIGLEGSEIGYIIDFEAFALKKIDNLVIYGYKGSAAETYAKDNEIQFVDLNHEHTWGTVTYKWSSDNKTCTATRTCLEDSSHVETETATATSKVTKEPTTTSTGTAVYTATFKNTVFKTQTKTVTLNKLPDDNKDYPDVKEGAWYYDAAQYCSEKGYISGYQNGNFGPNDNLKRQDFVVILSKIAGADLDKYAAMTPKLKDVKKGAYYAAAVNWAVDNNIIAGYANGNFGVNDNITREQVATILYRYMGSPDVKNVDSTLKKFSDVNRISTFAKTAVAWAVQNNVISGMADGRVAPTEGAARAQIASIIMRMDQQGMFDKKA